MVVVTVVNMTGLLSPYQQGSSSLFTKRVPFSLDSEEYNFQVEGSSLGNQSIHFRWRNGLQRREWMTWSHKQDKVGLEQGSYLRTLNLGPFFLKACAMHPSSLPWVGGCHTQVCHYLMKEFITEQSCEVEGSRNSKSGRCPLWEWSSLLALRPEDTGMGGLGPNHNPNPNP